VSCRRLTRTQEPRQAACRRIGHGRGTAIFGDGVKSFARSKTSRPKNWNRSKRKSIRRDRLRNDKDARDVIDLIRCIGVDAFDGGALANAVAVEALTAVLIAVNIKYKVRARNPHHGCAA